MADPKSLIRERALELGFEAVGFARAEAAPGSTDGLREFLAAGHHGDMAWMTANADRRGDPKVLWPEARSVVVLAMNYGPKDDPRDALERRDRGAISAYAQAADYHDVLKKKLRVLARWIAESFGAEVKLFVDTAPVMEKSLAQMAGLGWQGKHTNLVSMDFGSWLFLAEIFTTLDLSPDPPVRDHCGTCSACLDICPTMAFVGPGKLDARRCISYLTIEAKSQIPRELRAAMGNRIYGCDDCLAVCPWNKFAQTANETAFRPRLELTRPRLDDLAGLDDPTFRQVFAGSPIKRIGRDRFVRNVLVAIGNSGRAALAPAAKRLLDDPSSLVRGMAIWALGRLLGADEFEALRQAHAQTEGDPEVRAEWSTTGS